jgi:hypothetical protein
MIAGTCLRQDMAMYPETCGADGYHEGESKRHRWHRRRRAVCGFSQLQ